MTELFPGKGAIEISRVWQHRPTMQDRLVEKTALYQCVSTSQDPTGLSSKRLVDKGGVHLNVLSAVTNVAELCVFGSHQKAKM